MRNHAVAIALVACAPAGAQTFNIQLGDLKGAVDSSYGAAIEQPGRWNATFVPSSFELELLDTSGLGTGAKLIGAGDPLLSGPGDTGARGIPDGGFVSLMQSWAQLEEFFTDATFTFTGLQAGRYIITTYGGHGYGFDLLLEITVDGAAEPAVYLGWGERSGEFTLETELSAAGNYCQHTVDVEAGEDVVVRARLEAGLIAGVAGFQVTPVDSACSADCDGDGELTFFDFLCFQNLFAASDPGADCDEDGSLTFFDFLCFQNEFAAGCP
ncbi:MAG: GC-type dockerin domain-anchored protein [Phycisphaerales bacterium JB039]